MHCFLAWKKTRLAGTTKMVTYVTKILHCDSGHPKNRSQLSSLASEFLGPGSQSPHHPGGV